MLYFLITLFFVKQLPFGFYVIISSCLSLYYIWAIAQFFNTHKVWDYIKILLGYVIGLISFYVVVSIIGVSIDLYIKYNK